MLRREHNRKQITHRGGGSACNAPQHRNNPESVKQIYKGLEEKYWISVHKWEWENWKDHSPTSQLLEIVLPQPGDPLFSLADCYGQSSSRVYSEAAVNKCFSTKTHINKPSTNTVSLPTIVRCQMACELRIVTHTQKRAALLCLSPFNFILWTEISFAYPRASQSGLKPSPETFVRTQDNGNSRNKEKISTDTGNLTQQEQHFLSY